MDKEILEANERLLQKRRELKIGENREFVTIGQEISPSSMIPASPTSKPIENACRYHKTEVMTRETYGLRCPRCIDDELHQFYLVEEQRRLEASIRRKQDDTSAIFEAVQIGRRFVDLEWGDFIPPDANARRVLDFCRKYAADFASHRSSGSSLVFTGNSGTGKNMLSALIARDAVAGGFTALHTTTMKLIRRIRSTWGGKGNEEDAVRSFVRPDLLIVDEVGVQCGTASEERLLTEVLNDRYEARAPVILLSNLDVPELEKFLGFRVMDRLCEDGRVIPFTWQSHRRQR